MGWNTRVSSSGKDKDQRYLCMGGFLKFVFIIALLIARKSRKSVRHCFQLKVFPRWCLFQKDSEQVIDSFAFCSSWYRERILQA